MKLAQPRNRPTSKSPNLEIAQPRNRPTSKSPNLEIAQPRLLSCAKQILSSNARPARHTHEDAGSHAAGGRSAAWVSHHNQPRR